MNCIDLIEKIACDLLTIIRQTPGIQEIPTDDYGWINHRYHSPIFRLAHVEIFNQNNFSVVHCCVFPHSNNPSAIFGFDVIAGPNKITGVFLDLSPVVAPAVPFTNIQVEKVRERPEWGDIFSEHWVAARPSYDDMLLIGEEAKMVLEKYLWELTRSPVSFDKDSIIAKQNHYCHQQQQNPHTRRALINLLGEIGADDFMKNILFPKIEISQ